MCSSSSLQDTVYIARLNFLSVTFTLQRDLDEVRLTWEFHAIRYQKNQRSHHGKPYLMYTSPGLYNTRDFVFPTDDFKVELCVDECLKKSWIPCDETVFDTCSLFMLENNWMFPNDAAEGVELYMNLRRTIYHALGIVA